MLNIKVELILIFWGTSILFAIEAAPIYISKNSGQGSFSSTFLSKFFIPCLFDSSHSGRCKESSFWFWFSFPWWLEMFNIFWFTFLSLVCLLWENVYSDHQLIFKTDFCSNDYTRYLYILGISPLSDICLVNICSHSVGCLFILLMASFAIHKLISLM